MPSAISPIQRTAMQLGTAQARWTTPPPLTTALSITATALSADNAYLHVLTFPTGTTDTTTLGKLVLGPLVDFNNLILQFYGVGAAATAASWKLWGIRPVGPTGGEEFLCPYMAAGTFALGSTTVATGTKLYPATAKFADTITVTTDRTLSPATRVIYNQSTGAANLLLDNTGHIGNILEIVVGTTTSVGAQFCGL